MTAQAGSKKGPEDHALRALFRQAGLETGGPGPALSERNSPAWAVTNPFAPLSAPVSIPRMSDDVLLPDGSPFAFWDDQTTYVRTWHVDQAAAPADGGDGSAARPFARINQAAALAGPGERVLVRAGTYRECVRPARGGGGPAAMIHYQAAPGETVVISGAEPWTPAWSAPRKARASGLMVADLPLDRFSDAYNPFLATDLNRQPWFPWTKRPQAEILRALRRRDRGKP